MAPFHNATLRLALQVGTGTSGTKGRGARKPVTALGVGWLCYKRAALAEAAGMLTLALQGHGRACTVTAALWTSSPLLLYVSCAPTCVLPRVMPPMRHAAMSSGRDQDCTCAGACGLQCRHGGGRGLLPRGQVRACKQQRACRLLLATRRPHGCASPDCHAVSPAHFLPLTTPLVTALLDTSVYWPLKACCELHRAPLLDACEGPSSS